MAFSLGVLYATDTLGACLLLCEVSQKSIRGNLRYHWISTKRDWRLDLMQKNLLLFGCFRNVFITQSFCKWPLCTLQLAKVNTLVRFRKTMKTHGISRTQCWTLFVISKATLTKTAIKPKFVDIFSLKNFSAAIDQCTIKSLNFVSIENFLSCLT